MFKIAILCVASLALCEAFKQGAPIEACSKRIPRHDNTVPSYDSRKYSFTYREVGNGEYELSLDGKGSPFKGFMVQALDSRNQSIGQFHGDSENIQVIRECNSVTHYNARPKNKVTLVWTGPGQDVHFWATVVESYSKIYVDLSARPEGGHQARAPIHAPARRPHLSAPVSARRPHLSAPVPARRPHQSEPAPLYYPYEDERRQADPQYFYDF